MSEHDVAAIAKSLPVRDGDEPWTVEEVSEIIETLEHDVERMARSLAKSDEDLASLMQEGNDGAGKDTIDVGSSQFERDQEMSLNQNARTVFEQSRTAIDALEEGTYGTCESCGNPVSYTHLTLPTILLV